MHGVYHWLWITPCPVQPRCDLSFLTVITVQPAVVSGSRCHVSSIEGSCIDLSLSRPDILTFSVSNKIKKKYFDTCLFVDISVHLTPTIHLRSRHRRCSWKYHHPVPSLTRQQSSSLPRDVRISTHCPNGIQPRA